MPADDPLIISLPGLPRDRDGPIFREPWEAKAFALALQLAEAGVFTWAEWTNALSDEISTAKLAGEADLGDTYYMYWLRALERLAAQKGKAAPDEVKSRAEEWRCAYLNTPHGDPVELASARKSGIHSD